MVLLTHFNNNGEDFPPPHRLTLVELIASFMQFGGGGFSFGGGMGGMGGARADVDTTGLYKTLGVAKNATATEIKKVQQPHN